MAHRLEDESCTDTGRWAIREIRIVRTASSDQRSITSDATWGLAERVRSRHVRFEAHPLNVEFAFLVIHDEEFPVVQLSLPGFQFGNGNGDYSSKPPAP
jgi:hypothetical protein